MHRHSYLLPFGSDSESRLVVWHPANEHVFNVFWSGDGADHLGGSDTLVPLVQRCPLQRNSQVLPQMVEHGNLSIGPFDIISSRQKRIILFYAADVCFFHDIPGGLCFDSIAGAPAFVLGHWGPQFLLSLLPWGSTCGQSAILECNEHQTRQFLVFDGSRCHSYAPLNSVLCNV